MKPAENRKGARSKKEGFEEFATAESFGLSERENANGGDE